MAQITSHPLSSVWDDRRVVRLIDEIPGLRAALGPHTAMRAAPAIASEVHTLPAGEWDAESDPAVREGSGLGLMVLDGMLLRETRVGIRWFAELMGAGDLVRPWDTDVDAGASVPAHVRWEALTDVPLAVLDTAFVQRVARWPEVVEQVVGEGLQRSRRLSVNLALSQHTRLEVRLMAVLWTYADRWGTVTPEGVVVPVPLTHELLGRMAGAQRPSVTVALARLREDGVLERRRDGSWLLRGSPPADLEDGG